MRESCIQHRPGQRNLILCQAFRDIANGNSKAGLILGVYHREYSRTGLFPPMAIGEISREVAMMMAEKTARLTIKAMEEMGIVYRHQMSQEEAIAILQGKVPQSHGFFSQSCQWCGATTKTLHAHHYPIPACKGGTETVDICPNCHAEFHQLTDHPVILLTAATANELRQVPCNIWEV